jgi:ABC-type uncharacterized transport system substrate-binding protein
MHAVIVNRSRVSLFGLWDQHSKVGLLDSQLVGTILQTGSSRRSTATDEKYRPRRHRSTIPIVFGIGGDPVKAGLVTDLNRPGGNATGVSLLTPGLERKRVELLHEIVPRATLIAALVNPRNQLLQMQIAEVEEAARIIGTTALIVRTSDEAGLEAAFTIIHQRRCEALVVTVDPFFLDIRKQIAALAARLELPTIYGYREFAVAGGLMTMALAQPTPQASSAGTLDPY